MLNIWCAVFNEGVVTNQPYGSIQYQMKHTLLWCSSFSVSLSSRNIDGPVGGEVSMRWGVFLYKANSYGFICIFMIGLKNRVTIQIEGLVTKSIQASK